MSVAARSESGGEGKRQRLVDIVSEQGLTDRKGGRKTLSAEKKVFRTAGTDQAGRGGKRERLYRKSTCPGSRKGRFRCGEGTVVMIKFP